MSTVIAPAPVPPELGDADAIAAVLAGDRGKFAVLVRRHNQAVFRACRAVLHNDQDAEDAAQAAWLSAYRALAGFRADAAFKTWITRIAVNEAASRLRSRRRLAAVPTEELTMEHGDGPDREVYSQELARLLERELGSLPEGLRSVLVLRDVIELDTAETASCLGIAEENVRVRLHRARQALAHRLADSMQDVLATALPGVWRFDGARCARMLARVMAEVDPR